MDVSQRQCPLNVLTLVTAFQFGSFQVVIPFFSLLVKDLYFLNEGCAGKLANGHINFEVSGDDKK